MSTEVRQFTVQHDDDGVRLDRWFKRHLPQVGFATVSRWARTGQIRVDGKRADPADRLAAGQVVRVPPGGDTPAKGGAKPAMRPQHGLVTAPVQTPDHLEDLGWNDMGEDHDPVARCFEGCLEPRWRGVLFHGAEGETRTLTSCPARS